MTMPEHCSQCFIMHIVSVMHLLCNIETILVCVMHLLCNIETILVCCLLLSGRITGAPTVAGKRGGLPHEIKQDHLLDSETKPALGLANHLQSGTLRLTFLASTQNASELMVC